MRRPETLALIGLLLLLAPPAQALPWDDTITVPVPRSGDAGLYATEALLVDGEPVMVGDEGLAFELGPRTRMLDAYAVERPATRFHGAIVADDETVFDMISWVHARGAPPLATDLSFQAGGPGFAIDIQTMRYASRHHQPWGPECLLLTALQGVEVQEGAQLPLNDLCGQDLAQVAREEGATVSLQVAEVQTLENGGRAARFLVTAEAPYGELEADIWYRDDIPYPVEVTLRGRGTANATAESEVEASAGSTDRLLPRLAQGLLLMGGATDDEVQDRDGDDQVHFELTLVLERFQRGQGPSVEAGSLPAWPATSQRLELAPVDRWGPVDGGEAFPYPRDEAVEALTTDPTLAEFQLWLQDHPDARSIYVDHREDVERTQRVEQWWFIVAAPDGSAYQLFSRRTTELRTPGQGLLDAPVPVTRNEAHPFQHDDAEALLATVPERSPSTASALPLWEALAPAAERGTEANTLRWTVDEDGTTHELGWTDPGEGELTTSSWSWDHNSSMLTLDPTDGAVRHLNHMVTEYDFGPSLTGSPRNVGWSSVGFRGSGDRPAGLDAPMVVGVAGASLLVLVGLVLVKVGVGVPLYSRIARGELLDNPTRRRVYEALQDEGGLSLAAVAKRAGCSASTARYHLRRLATEDLVRAVGDRRQRRYFAAGAATEAEMAREAVLAVGNSRDAWEALRERPGASLGDLAEALDTSPPAAHKVVERLVEAGLVVKERDGRRVALYAVEEPAGTQGSAPGDAAPA